MLVLAVASLAVALLWFVIGVLLARAKNWKANSLVGYRTAKSMSSQELWIKANRFCGRCLMVCALPLLVVAGCSFVFMAQEKQPVFMAVIFIALLPIEIVISAVLTERHMSR